MICFKETNIDTISFNKKRKGKNLYHIAAQAEDSKLSIEWNKEEQNSLPTAQELILALALVADQATLWFVAKSLEF